MYPNIISRFKDSFEEFDSNTLFRMFVILIFLAHEDHEKIENGSFR